MNRKSLPIVCAVFLVIAMTFDPTQQAEVDTAQATAERQIGGLGIALLRKIADEVCYRREEEINELTIMKQL